jgi:hypothetical protein
MTDDTTVNVRYMVDDVDTSVDFIRVISVLHSIRAPHRPLPMSSAATCACS